MAYEPGPATTSDIITLATAAAGPRNKNETIHQYKVRLAMVAAEMADQRLLEDMDRVAQAIPLYGTVKSVERGEHSATIRIIATSGNEDTRGTVEEVKTDYLSRPSARAIADRAEQLVGHQVRWLKVNLPDPKGKVSQGFRTIVGIVDLGLPKDDPPASAAAPAPADTSTPPPAPNGSNGSNGARKVKDVNPSAEQMADARAFSAYLKDKYAIEADDIKPVAKSLNISPKTAGPQELLLLEAHLREHLNLSAVDEDINAPV